MKNRMAIPFRLISRLPRNWLIAAWIGALLFGLATPLPASAATSTPTFTIVKIERGVAVTLRTSNFTGSQSWTIRQGIIGTRAENGIIVGGLTSPASGTAMVRIPIAPTLAKRDQIAIRAENGIRYYYDFFDNQNYDDGSVAAAIKGGTPILNGGGFYVGDGQTQGGGFYVGDGQTQGGGFYVGDGQIQGGGFYVGDGQIQGGGFYVGDSIPSQEISEGAVPFVEGTAGVKDVSTTFKAQNLAPNKLFIITLKNAADPWGVSDVVVGTINSGPGGSLMGTVTIPASLVGVPNITIHVRSADGYFAFNNFLNMDY